PSTSSGIEKKKLHCSGALCPVMLNADEVALGNPRRKGTREQACSTGGCYVLFTGNSTRIVSEENGQPVAEDGRFLVFSASVIGGPPPREADGSCRGGYDRSAR
ncbi:MAG: hypothetical protein WCE98_00410, partial [Chlorobium sp.]